MPLPLMRALKANSPMLPRASFVVVVAFITFFPVTTSAQSPRDYLNTPVDAAAFFLDFLNNNSETAAQMIAVLKQLEGGQRAEDVHGSAERRST